MNVDLIIVLAFAYIFAYAAETEAMPAEKDMTSMKEVKEPKDIKEAATASKDLKDAIKAAKEAKKNKKDCIKECGTAYDPVCVHNPADASYKPRTFGTQCALDVHNCEKGTNLVVKNKGECSGFGGVRLS